MRQFRAPLYGAGLPGFSYSTIPPLQITSSVLLLNCDTLGRSAFRRDGFKWQLFGQTVRRKAGGKVDRDEDGDSLVLEAPTASVKIAPAFDAAKVEAAVRWAQRNDPDYSYGRFCELVMMAGCAGYLVSFSELRVVYFGRTAETHIEHFSAVVGAAGTTPNPDISQPSGRSW